MKLLISKLNKYFKVDKNRKLNNFIPEYKIILDKINLNLKKENINGTYLKEKIYENNIFEIVLITWGSHSKSPIHSHPTNGCILTILDGNLIEETYTIDNIFKKSRVLKNGDIGYIENLYGKHKIINENNHNVYSLHIYSPPKFYDNCK